MQPRRIYFLIVNYNSSELIRRLLDSLPVETIDNYQVIIINNSPSDRQIQSLSNDSVTIIEADDNLGFGKACNLGLDWIYRQHQQAIVWLINPDTYFDSVSNSKQLSPIKTAIAFFNRHSQISILGTTVYDSAGKITAAGGKFTPGTAALEIIATLPQDEQVDFWLTDWVSGCSLLINLANFSQCPSFDPRYFLYYEDLDFCLRYGQQEHKIAVTPLLKVGHDTSSITDRNLWRKYQHITKSYLIHIEKHGNLATFIITNLRMSLNTVRLLILKPQQGWGKLIGIYHYWRERLAG
ncbi:MAG: glycosyltransferase [Cyanobacteria bacterium J06607_15]